MSGQQSGISIEELADEVGISVRTVRFYIGEGLIPGPGGRGKSASYGQEHLLRLHLIRRLSEQRVPLADIKIRLSGLTMAEIEDLLETEARLDAELQQADRSASAKEYISTLLSRAREAQQLEGGDLHEPDGDLYRVEKGRRLAPAAEHWQRRQLAPGLELHVRRDAAAGQRKLIEQIRRLAKQDRPERRGKNDEKSSDKQE